MKRLFLAGLMALVAVPAFAQVKISELPASAQVEPDTEIPAVQLGSTVKITPALPWTFGFPAAGGISTLTLQNTNPLFELRKSNGTANNQRWRQLVVAGALQEGVCADDGVTCTVYRQINRSGTTVSSVTESANAYIWSGTNSPWTVNGSTGTAGQVFISTGNATSPQWASLNGQALTRTNDTNVTLTLGGTPTTALLNAASITAGWTGTLSVARGGTGVGTLTGIAKGNGTSAFTAAASSDITGTFSGTCNGTSFLRGDGACAVPAGTGATYTTGTFTATWETACTTNPTQTWKYVVVGTLVTLTATQDISCTSDSGTFTASGALPVGIRPDVGHTILGARIVDNGVADVQPGCLRVETDGSLTWFRSVASPCAGTAYTTSGTKSISFGSASNSSPRTFTFDMDAI